MARIAKVGLAGMPVPIGMVTKGMVSQGGVVTGSDFTIGTVRALSVHATSGLHSRCCCSYLVSGNRGVVVCREDACATRSV